MKQRFEREAQTIAGLNHPNICTLFDVGRQGDIDFLVMEYLEGETLAARIGRGALPLDEAMKVADRDCGCAGQGARAGGDASRPEAGQRDADRRRAPSCSTSAWRS